MTTWTKEQQAEHRKLWVEALRSGKYAQATERLRKGGGMCCLGVACDISELGAWNPCGEYETENAAPALTVLPFPVRDWLGLRDCGSEFVTESGAYRQLSELNDNGTTFAEIALIIESEPHGFLA